jgi:hypothetical protein
VDPDVHRSAVILVAWIRIRIGNGKPDQGGQKGPTKIVESEKVSCFVVLVVLFLRAEGFFCILDVLRGRLRYKKSYGVKKKIVFIRL